MNITGSFQVSSSYQYNPQIMERIHLLLDRALTDHAQVLLIRFDVRYPTAYHASDDNTLFQQFIENYCRYLRRHEYSPLYLWCRERNTSDNPHYHVVFLLDGTRIRYMPNLNHANKIFCELLDLPVPQRGLLHFCNPNGTLVHRGDHDAYEAALDYVSYLAKTYTKITLPGTRSWSSSLL